MSLNAGEALHPAHTAVGFEDLEKLKSCALIADDLMNINATEFQQLKTLLDRVARHNNVSPVILISHCIGRTGLYSLLSHLCEIWFTLEKGNCQAIALTCEALKFGKTAKNDFITRFLEASEKFGIFILSTQKRTFEMRVCPPRGGKIPKVVAPPPDLEPYRRTAELYIPHFCADSKKSMCVFNYILLKLPTASLHSDDLTISLQRKESKSAQRFSILDWLVCLEKQIRPSNQMRSLHRYIIRHVQLPDCMITNKYMKKL